MGPERPDGAEASADQLGRSLPHAGQRTRGRRRRLSTGYVAPVPAGKVTGTLSVIALVAGLAACTGHGGGRAAGPTVPAPPATLAPPSAELASALLTVQDMPAGLTDIGRNYTGVETCGMRTEMSDEYGRELPTAGAAFARDADPVVPDVFEKIVAAPTGGGATVLQSARGHLDMCNNGGEADGRSFLSSTPLTVPALGDESVARRLMITVEATGATVGIDVLYARAGDTVVAVGAVEPTGRTDRLVGLATLALHRATG